MNPYFLLFVAGCSFQATAPAEPDRNEKSVRDQEEEATNGWFEGGEQDAPMGGSKAEAARPAAAAPSRQAALEPGDDGLLDDRKHGRGEEKDKQGDLKNRSDEGEGKAAPLRSWFPESFLWEPLVETDKNGQATVQVRVPDSLTTWRVLALGVTQDGAQGGATTSFRSTLPAYVDLKLPALLHVGDRLDVPVQIVNQTGALLVRNLLVQTMGGSGQGSGRVSVGGFGSALERVRVGVDRAGMLVMEAGLEGLDRVQRSVPVLPVGRPVEQLRGGTLASDREFSLDVPPNGSDASIEVMVYSGSLSVVSAELGRVAGGSVWEDAYGWSLLGSADPLIASGELSEDRRRELRLLALQRMRKHTRNNALGASVAVLSALRGSTEESLEGKLALRLENSLMSAQAPDGLWPGASSGLDDILVSTSQAVWALGPENRANRLRAQGAFERYRDRLSNPYVAAWALVAGVVEPQRVEVLKKLVLDSVQTAPDGSKFLPASGRRGDGGAATVVEATALAALIFKDDKGLSSDLVTYLLGHRSPGVGFGDGLSGLLSLRALEVVLGAGVPEGVGVSLVVDGSVVGEGVVDPKQPFAPVRMSVPVGAGSHSVRVVPKSAVPGLAFSLVQRSYVPWVQADPAGLDLVVGVPEGLRVGVSSSVGVRVVGPVGGVVDAFVGLPPGMAVSTPALESMVGLGVLKEFGVEDGGVWLRGVSLGQGVWEASLLVTPGYSGSLMAGASSVARVGEDGFYRVPGVWEVEG